VRLRELAKVQRQREWPTRFIQVVQSVLQKKIVGGALRSQEATKVPVIAVGVWRGFMCATQKTSTLSPANRG
jgi:hypothetical protein